MEYIKLKKKDDNKEANKYIIDQFDLLINLVDEVDKSLQNQTKFNTNIDINLPLNLTEMDNFLQTNPYYKPIFESWVFFLSLNSNKKLQNDCFVEIYNETEKALEKPKPKNKISVEKRVFNNINKKYQEKLNINDYSIFKSFYPNFKYLRK